MVDPSRFEYSEGQLDVSDTQTHKTHQNMPRTPDNAPAGQASEIDALRLKLTSADSERRKILAELFLVYPHDLAPITKTLFAEASLGTLQKVEFLLSVDLPKEGGAS